MSSAWKARNRLSQAHSKCSPRCVQSLHVNVLPWHFGFGVVVSCGTPSDSLQQTTSIQDQVWYHLMIRGRTHEDFDLPGCGKVRKSFLFSYLCASRGVLLAHSRFSLWVTLLRAGVMIDQGSAPKC